MWCAVLKSPQTCKLPNGFTVKWNVAEMRLSFLICMCLCVRFFLSMFSFLFRHFSSFKWKKNYYRSFIRHIYWPCYCCCSGSNISGRKCHAKLLTWKNETCPRLRHTHAYARALNKRQHLKHKNASEYSIMCGGDTVKWKMTKLQIYLGHIIISTRYMSYVRRSIHPSIQSCIFRSVSVCAL